jgi:His-Xaa-Ser system radical SAM maturase HxsC
MRRVKLKAYTARGATPHRVILFDELAQEWQQDLNFLVIVASEDEITRVKELNHLGMENIGWIIHSDDLEVNDVILPVESAAGHIVLYRETDTHHVLQVTNRCNSRCLMCSQPPTVPNDLWMYHEALLTVKHVKNLPPTLGVSGGEPLVLEEKIRDLINFIHERRSDTHVELLTNGRYLANRNISDSIFKDALRNVSWLVPLYGHCDFMHDYVVQSKGAFEETISGLLVLQKNQQAIQLRIVLIRPVLENLQELCDFIGRNLPFIREVSLMACEPIGYALANQEQCFLDLKDWSEVLVASVKILERFRIPIIFMNTPLCSLPNVLHKYAHKSISDWKNVYADECVECEVKEQCCGLFAWHEKGWKPTKIKAIGERNGKVC